METANELFEAVRLFAGGRKHRTREEVLRKEFGLERRNFRKVEPLQSQYGLGNG
jgi:hypothetical protein